MKNAIRTRLLLPFCMILFAVSGVLLHAASAPIRKLPDKPEESSSVVKKLPDGPEDASAEAGQDAKPGEKKGAKTEAEAIKVITERLGENHYTIKPNDDVPQPRRQWRRDKESEPASA